MVNSTNDLWLIARDFNSILDASDRAGGANISRVGCIWFQDFIFNKGLRDLGFSGPRFTWGRGTLLQRLDRALANSAWDSFAPSCLVCHLSHLKSNHRPILVSLRSVSIRRPRPFRCLDSWMLHPSFKGLVKNSWCYDRDVLTNLYSL